MVPAEKKDRRILADMAVAKSDRIASLMMAGQLKQLDTMKYFSSEQCIGSEFVVENKVIMKENASNQLL